MSRHWRTLQTLASLFFLLSMQAFAQSTGGTPGLTFLNSVDGWMTAISVLLVIICIGLLGLKWMTGWGHGGFIAGVICGTIVFINRDIFAGWIS